MKVYTNIKAGLGDILANQFSALNYFKPNPTALALARMVEGYRNGSIEEIAIVRDGGNPAAIELFDAWGFPQRTAEYCHGWVHAKKLTEPKDIKPLPVPTIRPKVALPRKYILFSEVAGGELERCLDDPEIYHLLRSTGLPVVKVGRDEKREDRPWTKGDYIPCNINLTNKTTVPETAWLAKNAACIVAPLSFHRVWASLFGKPVIELIQDDRVTDRIGERTTTEYEHGYYGIQHNGLNRWFKWPLQSDEVKEHLYKICGVTNKPVPVVQPDNVPGMKFGWVQTARSASNTATIRAILNTEPDNFYPDMNVLKLTGLDTTRPLRVLDFGAGMLRNSFGLLSLSDQWQITAYDASAMLRRGIKHFNLQQAVQEGRLVLASDWGKLKAERFDLIFCALVLQHIDAEPLGELVKDFTAMSNRLFVFGRKTLDNGQEDVWPIIDREWKLKTAYHNHQGKWQTLDDLTFGDKEYHAIGIYDLKH